MKNHEPFGLCTECGEEPATDVDELCDSCADQMTQAETRHFSGCTIAPEVI